MESFVDYYWAGRKGHLIGIGGVSMSPLAEVLAEAGLVITGSDINDSNNVEHLPCDEELFTKVVKTSFNQRRKTLSNSLKPILQDHRCDLPVFRQRPEQLSVDEFVELTNIISEMLNRNI